MQNEIVDITTFNQFNFWLENDEIIICQLNGHREAFVRKTNEKTIEAIIQNKNKESYTWESHAEEDLLNLYNFFIEQNTTLQVCKGMKLTKHKLNLFQRISGLVAFILHRI